MVEAMAHINSYRDLQAWKKSMKVAERGYSLTRRFSRDDQPCPLP